MAKKTSTKAAPKPAPEKAAAPETAKPAKPATPPKAIAKKTTPPPASAPGITSDAIGYAAGDVWNALHGKGWQTLATVKKAGEGPADVTLMAIGWLAREGKLDFATNGKTVKLTLK